MEKKENKLGNLEPSGRAKINGVLTKREQLITMKARGVATSIHGNLEWFCVTNAKRKCDYETAGAFSLLCTCWEALRRGEKPLTTHSHSPALVFFFCPILFCPLSYLQEEQVSIGRLVSGAHVTVLWFRNSPGCRNEALQHRQTGRKEEYCVTAHCCGGTWLISCNYN